MKPVALTSILFLTGCASMAEGTMEPSQEVLFTSSPTGAEVRQGPRVLCETPCRMRRAEMRLMEGYEFVFPSGEAVDVPLEIEGNGALLGNILFGGLIGGAVDLASGRGYVRQGHVHVEASEAQQSEPPPDAQ